MSGSTNPEDFVSPQAASKVNHFRPPEEKSPFEVPLFLHLLGGVIHHSRDLWLNLGRLETSLLSSELNKVPLQKPIFICGLARSGSTILHEIISSHPAVATQRIKDYPMVFTPHWWRRAAANLPSPAPRQRSHQDGVLITMDSPDALEEMLWMAFFPRCHDPSVSNVLTPQQRCPGFESFYQAHLRKLLLAEDAQRYAAKDNYHISRLTYLVHLFPDVRIILPVREPAGHIASLMRQHQLFSRGQRKYPRALAFMRRSGHFEFGLDRRPMNLGDDDRVRQIKQAWSTGAEVYGQALYWDMVHRYLAKLIATDEKVRKACHVVPFETLCANPEQTLRMIFDHCALPGNEVIVGNYVPKIRKPNYYSPPFASADLAIIRRETAETARQWGYGDSD